MISSYFLDNGYPLNDDALPCALHECLATMDDQLCVPIIEFLLSRNIDINRQQPNTWLTAIHIAVGRQLTDSVNLLIHYEADVNAVASGDSMPLNVAIALEDSNPEKAQIIAALLSKGML